MWCCKGRVILRIMESRVGWIYSGALAVCDYYERKHKPLFLRNDDKMTDLAGSRMNQLQRATNNLR